MQIVSNWRDVLRHAWSIRLIIAAVLLDALTTALGIDPYLLPIPLWAVASFSGVISSCAFLSRILAQREITK